MVKKLDQFEQDIMSLISIGWSIRAIKKKLADKYGNVALASTRTYQIFINDKLRKYNFNAYYKSIEISPEVLFVINTRLGNRAALGLLMQLLQISKGQHKFKISMIDMIDMNRQFRYNRMQSRKIFKASLDALSELKLLLFTHNSEDRDIITIRLNSNVFKFTQ